MAKTILLVHGRAPKPSESDLKGFWIEALRYGLERDRPDKLAEFDRSRIEFIYYGDLNNEFLDSNHDLARDAASRRITLDELKAYSMGDFDKAHYDNLPGKSSLKEFVADTFSGVARFFGASDSLIHMVAPDMREYWNSETEFGSDVRFPIIRPLKEAMDRNDTILVIGHSLGSMISYDTFWKFSRTGEYRPDYTGKKIDLFISICSPLGDETVKSHLKGSDASGARRYPSNIRRWVNIAAEDDFVAHDERLADDYLAMERYGLIESIRDHRVYNLAVRDGKSNPHHGAGYLIHPVTADILAGWL